MTTVADIVVGLIALLHVYIMVLEMFLFVQAVPAAIGLAILLLS